MTAPADRADPPADLEHNRRGELSPAQRRALDAIAGGAELGPLLLLVALLQVAGLLGAVVWMLPLPRVLAGTLALVVTAAIVAGGGVLLARWRRARREAVPATPERVAVVDGEVRWGGQHWQAVGAPAWLGGAGATPAPMPLGPVALPPGRYRFYVHEAKLVGAEVLAPGGGLWSVSSTLEAMGVGRSMWRTPSGATRQGPLSVGDPAQLMAVLAHALGFTADDLEQNRRGALSPRQGGGPAHACEGVAQLRWRLITKATVRYELEVGGQVFSIPLGAFGALVPGVSLRAYYAAPARLVSVELSPHTPR